LVAGDKSGVGQERFYRRLIARADARYAEHLTSRTPPIGSDLNENAR
jgi:hypothetical protein